MKVLVTGSRGHLGGAVAAALARRHQVRGYDSRGGKDILCRDALAQALAGVDVCVHSAGMADLNICEQEEQLCQAVNVDGAVQVGRQCAELGVRLIFISTVCAYGNNGQSVQVEDSPLYPTEIYARSKAWAERELAAIAGLDYLVLRPATFYGPGMRKELAVQLFLNACLNAEPILIHGDGRQTRSYVHVDDVVSAITLLAERWPARHRAFNCAGPETLSTLELAQICMAETKTSVPLEYIIDRPGQIRSSNIDSSRLKSLGWQAQVDIRTGIRNLLQLETKPVESLHLNILTLPKRQEKTVVNKAKKANGERLARKVGRFLREKVCIFLNSFVSDQDLTWPQRAFVYGLALLFGLGAAYSLTEPFLYLLEINAQPEQPVIHPKIPTGIFLFSLVLSIGTWIIRTADAKKQFADTLNTQKNAAFTEAVRLLVEGTPVSARGAGLAEIAALLHQNPKEYEGRIKRVTASGLRLGEEALPQSEKKEAGNEEDSLQLGRKEAGTKQDLPLKPVAREEKIKVALQGADLSKLQMPNADLRGARLQEVNLFGVNLKQALLQKVILQDADLQEADLERANLEIANLARADLERANLQGAYLLGTNLAEANLEGADLRGANLLLTKFARANLQRANLQRVNVNLAHLTAGMYVPGPDFKGANLKGANLLSARLPKSNFEEADLTKAQLVEANLKASGLRAAELQGAELQGADLREVDLREAKLQGANLAGALYSEKTKFPDGFDPDAAGMQLVEDNRN